MPTKKISNIFIQNAHKPWNIYAPSFASLMTQDYMPENAPKSEKWDAEKWREYFCEFIPQRPKSYIDENGIAHISVFGVLLNDETPLWVAQYGGTNYGEIVKDILEYSQIAKGILLEIDSPGGDAKGNSVAAEAVSTCGIPVFAHTNGYCCSAAYAIASGSSRIGCGKDDFVGSIGTILPLLDISGYWEQWGIKADYITNKEGDLKAAGYPPSQNEDERASLQAGVQSFYELFKNHVKASRENIPDDAMRGQAFVGSEALKNGLVDIICTREKMYSSLKNLTR